MVVIRLWIERWEFTVTPLSKKSYNLQFLEMHVKVFWIVAAIEDVEKEFPQKWNIRTNLNRVFHF